MEGLHHDTIIDPPNSDSTANNADPDISKMSV